MAVDVLANYPDPSVTDRTSLLQLAYGLLVNLSVVNTGLAFGFSAVALPQLTDPGSDVPVTKSQASWIASALSLSPPAGCFITGYLTDRAGRRVALILSEFPFIAGSIMLGLAGTPRAIIAGRVIMGVGCGMVLTPVRVYCSEMALPNLRGVIGAFPCVALALGVLLQAWLGSFLNWRWLCCVSGVYPVLLLMCKSSLPESPYYLLMRGDLEGAKKNLAKFRSRQYDVDSEMEEMIEFKRVNRIVSLGFKEKMSHLFRKSSCKPFGVLGVYFAVTQLSGVTVITFYAVDIIKRSGASINELTGNIMLGVTRLLCGVLASVLLYHMGRRPLTFISGIGCGVCFVLLGGYVWLVRGGADGVANPGTARSWVPAACCLLYMMFATIGYFVIPIMMIGELYPLQVRGILGGLSITLTYLFIFLSVHSYPYAVDTLKFHVTFVFYGLCSIVGCLFFYFFLPETKDLTLQEIEEFYNGRRPTLVSERMLLSRSVMARSVHAATAPSGGKALDSAPSSRSVRL